MTDSQPHPPEAHSHSKSPSGSPVELGARVNWNPLGDLRPPSEAPYAYHEHLPTNAINTFHEESAQRWIVALIISGVAVFGFSHYHLSAALSVLAVGKSVEAMKHDFAWDFERERGRNAAANPDPPPESVEWLNHALAAVWPILDPELFMAAIDLLEDALKALSPSIVRSARIASFSHGSNSLRLLGFKQLPDSFDITSTAEGPTPSVKVHPPNPNPGGPGVYVNVEVEFAYRRLPPPSSKSSNIHFLLHLTLGTKLVNVELPCWVGLTGLHGRLRLRLEMVPDPPFVRHVCFSFPVLPEIEIVAKPLKSLNLMNMPGISPFILSSINSVLANFIAPKSYEIDLSRFFLGSDVAMSTSSIGVICLVIHGAQSLAVSVSASAAHTDTLVNISYSRIGRTRYSTRVAFGTRDPIWEEVAFVRLTGEDLDEHERLRLAVIDNDSTSKEGRILGFADVSVTDLCETPATYVHATAALQTSHRGTRAEGTLSYSAAFFPLATFKHSQPSGPPDAAEDLPAGRPPPQKGHPMFADRSIPEGSRSGAYAQRMREMLDGRLPPNPLQCTGILGFQIHQITQLERKGRSFPSHGGRDLPSSHCSVFVNDEKVFQSRTKPMSSSPYFNTGSEVFIRDWSSARIDFAVMDTHDRDFASVLGIVSIDLKELFETRSQVTRWFNLANGEGAGRIRLSFLYKPLDIELLPAMREWSVGTLEINSVTAAKIADALVARLDMREAGSAAQFSTGAVAARSDKFGSFEVDWELGAPITIPFFRRHSAKFEVRLAGTQTTLANFDEVGSGTLPLGSVFSGLLSLHTISLTNDDSPPVRLPLSHLPHTPPRKRPTLDTPKKRRKDAEGADPPPIVATSSVPDAHSVVAVVQLTARWSRGLSKAHRDHILEGSADEREAYQVWLHRAAPEQLDRGAIRIVGAFGHDHDNGLGVGEGVSSGPQSRASSAPNSRRSSLSLPDFETSGRDGLDGPRPDKMRGLKWVSSGVKKLRRKSKLPPPGDVEQERSAP